MADFSWFIESERTTNLDSGQVQILRLLKLTREQASKKESLWLKIQDLEEALDKKYLSGCVVYKTEAYYVEYSKDLEPLVKQFTEITGPIECYRVPPGNYELCQVLPALPAGATKVRDKV